MLKLKHENIFQMEIQLSMSIVSEAAVLSAIGFSVTFFTFQIDVHCLTRIPFLAHEKNRHEQDVWNFSFFLFFPSFCFFTWPLCSADNRKMYKADGQTIA